MTSRVYAVFFPLTGNAMTSDQAATFSSPAKVDFFPNTTGLITNCFLPVSDWSDGVEQTLSITGSGSGAGRIVFDPISITRNLDNISSAFLVLCAQGTEFKYVDLLIQRVDSSNVGTTYLGYRFGQAAVESIKWVSDEEQIQEQLTLEYGTLSIGYSAQNASGAYGTPVFRGWDRINNVRI